MSLSLSSHRAHLLTALWLLTIPLGLGACTECDLREEAQKRAGADAVDCGAVELGASPVEAHACTADAFESGQGFFAIFEKEDENGIFVTALAGNEGGAVWLLVHGEECCDGSAATRIERGSCFEPSVRTVDETTQDDNALPLGARYVDCSQVSSFEPICED